MTAVFIPEDGTRVDGANAYLDLSRARDLLQSRGDLAAWDGTALTKTVTVDATSDAVAHALHGFLTGDGPLTYTNAGGALPGGLIAGTEYWAVVVDAGHYQVAESYADAVAAVPTIVDLLDAGTGTQTEHRPDFAEQRGAIVTATDYVERRWAEGFLGYVSRDDVQGLSWPRRSAYDRRGKLIEGLPGEVELAIALLALRAIADDLEPDLPDGDLSSESVSDGPSSRSVVFAGRRGPRFPAVESAIRPVLSPTTAARY